MDNLYQPPKSDLKKEGEIYFQPHGFWKFFFWIHVIIIPLILIAIFIEPNLSVFDFIDVATLPIIVLALFGYVHSKKLGTQLFWKIMTYLYPLWAAFYGIIVPFVLGIEQYGEPVELDAWLLLMPAFCIPTGMAFYLYAFKSNHIWIPEHPHKQS